MKILDLFCKAGGASYGMFWVDPLNIELTGYDVQPQLRYPFDFTLSDYASSDPGSYDFVWASPPCWAYSRVVPRKYRSNHPDLIEDVRSFLSSFTTPYCIENVPCSPLNVSLKLRGEMFGLPVQKERWFETSFFLMSPGNARTKPVFNHNKGNYKEKAKLMNLSWMNSSEYNNAIPPAYSYYILNEFLKQNRSTAL